VITQTFILIFFDDYQSKDCRFIETKDLRRKKETKILKKNKQLHNCDHLIISNESYISNSTSTIITWSTENSSQSVFSYGLTNSYGTTITQPLYTNAHSVTLTGLNEGTTYYYDILATDIYLNVAESNSHSFITISDIVPNPPIIVNFFISIRHTLHRFIVLQ